MAHNNIPDIQSCGSFSKSFLHTFYRNELWYSMDGISIHRGSLQFIKCSDDVECLNIFECLHFVAHLKIIALMKSTENYFHHN